MSERQREREGERQRERERETERERERDEKRESMAKTNVFNVKLSISMTSISPLQAYGTQLTRKVQYRHVLARSYFSRIPEMAEQMKSKVQELPLPRPKEREIVARVRPQVDGQVQTAEKQLVTA